MKVLSQNLTPPKEFFMYKLLQFNGWWVLLLLMVSLTTGCNSLPQNVALGAVIGTGVGAVISGNDSE